VSGQPPAASSRPARVWFVDVVRLLASLQMVNGHTIDAVLLPSIEQGPIFDNYNWARGLVSVCFLMVAGIAFHLSSLARYDQHRRNPAAIRRRFRRALVVIAGGYFLGFPWAATSPDPAQAELAWRYFTSAGILHCIGAALIMLELLVLASHSARQVVAATGVLAVLAFAFAPAADGTLTRGEWHPLLNWISHGGGSPFPLLPWAGNVFAGVVVGWIVLPQGGHTAHRVIWSRLAALAGVAGFAALAAQASPWTLVEATTHPSARPAFVVSNLAAVLVLTLLLSVVTAPMHTMPRLLRILSGETLTIYMFHLVVLFGFNLQLARRIGETQTLPRALGLAVGMIVLTSAYTLAWHRFKSWRHAKGATRAGTV
jgi:uncharacterized membrane protein